MKTLIGLDDFNLALKLLTCTSYFNLAFVPGWTNNEFPVLHQYKTFNST